MSRVQSGVQSISRAFAVLGALEDGPRGVTEVAERVGLPKSTVARMLATLVREGAVEQLADDARYRLGPRIAALGRAVEPARDLISIAHPHLVELAALVGETAGLSVPDGDVVHYVDQVDADHEVQVRDWTGTRVPMHAVPSGQLFLANLEPSALDAFLSRPLAWFTPQTLDDPVRLRERLERVRRAGHAWVREEFAEGLASVAAGIVDPTGVTVAAVHVHGPSYRFPAAGAIDPVTAAVVASAGRIGAAIGAAIGRQSGRATA